MCQSCLCSRYCMSEVFYGSYACYYVFECRLFPFVAARHLTDFLCSKFDENGVPWWVGQIYRFVSLMCNLPIGVVAFLV